MGIGPHQRRGPAACFAFPPDRIGASPKELMASRLVCERLLLLQGWQRLQLLHSRPGGGWEALGKRWEQNALRRLRIHGHGLSRNDGRRVRGHMLAQRCHLHSGDGRAHRVTQRRQGLAAAGGRAEEGAVGRVSHRGVGEMVRDEPVVRLGKPLGGDVEVKPHEKDKLDLHSRELRRGQACRSAKVHAAARVVIQDLRGHHDGDNNEVVHVGPRHKEPRGGPHKVLEVGGSEDKAGFAAQPSAENVLRVAVEVEGRQVRAVEVGVCVGLAAGNHLHMKATPGIKKW